MPDPITPMFRTPEEVAPELGLKPTTLRRLCRQTGICTRLERGRITLTEENVADIVVWIKTKSAEPVFSPNGEMDPFA